MRRLTFDIGFAVFAVVFVKCVVLSEYYVEQPTHIYVVEGPEDFEADLSSERVKDDLPENQFMSRRGGYSQEV